MNNQLTQVQDNYKIQVDENQKLVTANEKLTEETRRATKENTDACAALIKLDEARVVMNKLLGP